MKRYDCTQTLALVKVFKGLFDYYILNLPSIIAKLYNDIDKNQN